MRSAVPTYALYGEDKDGLGAFWIHSESIAARSSVHHWEIREHRHDAFFQILDIRSGDGELVLPDGTLAIGPGALVTVPPGVAHGFRFSPDIDGNVLTFVLSRLPMPEVGEGLYRQALRAQLDDRYADARLIRALLLQINAEVAAGFGFNAGVVQSCLLAVMALIARLGAVGQVPEGQDERDFVRIEKLKTLIALFFREHKPVEFYAEKLALTPAHLNRICRKVTGQPVGRLIAERQMEEARRDLMFTSMTIQQIAFDLGFADPAYFNRFFSREAGLTPKSYRDQEKARFSGEN